MKLKVSGETGAIHEAASLQLDNQRLQQHLQEGHMLVGGAMTESGVWGV
jgi:hypothetical protein